MRVRVAQNAPHSGARVIENIQGLPQVMLSNTSLKLERRRSDYRLDGDRDGLLVFFVGIILFRVAAAVYPSTDLLVAAAPGVMLASGVTIASVTPNTSRRVVGQWRGAGGAVCADHLAFCGELLACAAA